MWLIEGGHVCGIGGFRHVMVVRRNGLVVLPSTPSSSCCCCWIKVLVHMHWCCRCGMMFRFLEWLMLLYLWLSLVLDGGAWWQINPWFTCCAPLLWAPRVATQTYNYRGLVQKIHIGMGLCTHNRTHNLDYVSNNLQLSTTEVGLKSFKMKAGEKPPREVGKRVSVRAYKPI